VCKIQLKLILRDP